MALLTIPVDIVNPVPVNGQYVFTVQFVNADGTLTNDSRFPQNQGFTEISLPAYLNAEVANGSYTIGDIRAKVLYKNKSIFIPLQGKVINCQTSCGNFFPVTTVTSLGSNNYQVTLSQTYTGTLGWKVYNMSGTLVASGTANTAGTNFNITIPALEATQYLLEVSGTTCIGKSIKTFTGASTKPPCGRGPTISSVIETTPTSIKVLYDGDGIFAITWRVKNSNGDVVRNGVIKYIGIAEPGDATFDSNTPTVNFAALAAGNYTLEFEGNLCTSAVSSIAVIITGTVEPLAFVSGSPSATGSSGNYTLSIAINKTGSYVTTVLNSTTGTYYRNNVAVAYTANTPITIGSLPVGDYVIKVGTLQTQLTIADSGGTPCANIGRNPVIASIINSSTTSLEFGYDAENVTSFKWRIKQSGTTVRNGIGYPTNNHPVITFAELPAGSYVLEIEGNNCTSPVDTEPFTITAVTPGNNAGLRIQQVGNRTFLWRDGMNFRLSVNPSNGAVTISYPETKTSPGGKQIKGYLLNEQEAIIADNEKDALRAGAQMMDGEYYFFLRYAATDIISNWSQAKANIWPLFLNPETKFLNGDRMETISLEIVTNVTI